MDFTDIPQEFINWLFQQKEAFAIFYRPGEITFVEGAAPLGVWHEYASPPDRPFHLGMIDAWYDAEDEDP